MGVFLGKIIKSILWLCLFVLLGAFFFGLIKFKGDFMEYIRYLDSISVKEIFTSQGTGDIQQEIESGNITNEIPSDEDLSGVLNDEGYFLPEANSGLQDGESFGFSGNLDTSSSLTGKQDLSSLTGKQETSLSKKDLVNLIKSHEK